MPKERESLKPENLIELARFVKSYRKKNKITQEELAKFSNVSRFAISEFESGKSDIKLSTLFKNLKACSLVIEVKER